MRALRVRVLRIACPTCWLLDVSRLIASRMVFRAQAASESPASERASVRFVRDFVCVRVNEACLNPAAPMLQREPPKSAAKPNTY